jgi:energy-coupling factor transport system permease protein
VGVAGLTRGPYDRASRVVELHPAAWLAWLSGACAVAFLTSNPLYLSLALLATAGVYVVASDTAKGRLLSPFVKLGLAIALLYIPFNTLTGSTGTNVLLTLPALRFPDWFGGVVFGGDVTAEALMSALGRALTIATLVLAAGAFNASVDHFRLLRLAPRGLSQIALVLSIGLLSVPQAAAHARVVAEAQRLRGYRARGWRAVPGVLLPTLQGALERSVQRAESLDARGFGAGETRGGIAMSLAGAGGLGVVAWGSFAHFYYGPAAGPSLAMAAGTGLVAFAIVGTGGGKRERMRREHWSPLDVAVAVSAAVSVVLLLWMRLAGAGDADYLAYPEVVAPAFHPVGALASLLLLMPATPQLRLDREEAL